MVTRLCRHLVMAASLCLAFGAAAASAATVDLSFDAFGRGELARAQAERTAFRASLDATSTRGETFAGYTPWGTEAGTQRLRNTAVGAFARTGARGSGYAVVGDGGRLQVRSDNDMRWGRYNPEGEGGSETGNWLDSNDNRGIKWTISGVGKFDSVGFFLSDVADVGGKFSIKVGDTLYSNLAGATGRLENGNLHFVRILLGEAVDSLTIKLMHDRPNDGFGVGGFVVGAQPPAPVPLPPALALSGTAAAMLAGVGLLRRRRNGAGQTPA